MKTKLSPKAAFFQLRALVGFALCLAGLLIGLAGLSKSVTGTNATTPTPDPHHRHHHYKLIVVGTLGGPQSYGDPGHGAANTNNQGIAAGVADTATPDPFYPNFNPNFSGNIGSYPFIYHGFTTRDGTLRDLGGLQRGLDSSVSFITENGLVSGQALNGSIDPITGWPASSGVLWKDGRNINLGTLGGYESQAGRVNSRGQVTGISTNTIPDPFSFYYPPGTPNATQLRGFLWDEKNGMQDIGTLGGPDALAPLINERGQIAGFSYTSDLAVDPFLWDRGRMIDLGTLGGTFGLIGGAFALNNRGEVVGQSNLAGDTETHAFLWSQGTLTDIGTLGGTFGVGNAINEAGEVAGYATTAGDQEVHAFFWSRGVIEDLGSLPNYDSTCVAAFGINSQRQIVGQATENFCAGPGAHAFLWENGHIIDLNVLVPPGSGIILQDVEMINDRGEMFGEAVLDNGDSRAFQLIPCDENHPGLEGCDYSMVEAPAAVAQHLSTTTPVSPALTGRGILDRFRARHFPGLRVLDSGTNR